MNLTYLKINWLLKLIPPGWYPTFREVDIPIENGFVGMVDREHFDEFLRVRASKRGATRFTGTFQKIDRDRKISKGLL